MSKYYRDDFTYPDFGHMFKADIYDPNRWANIFKASGAKYVVLVSKHHEGFTLWPSNYSWNWNAWDVGPRRDLVGELATAIRANTDIKFGMYHSMFEWFNPVFNRDASNNYQTQDFVKTKTMPELYELVNRYKPEIVWSDGEWMAPDTYWNSTEFIAWLFNDSPVRDTVVVNDRWGSNTRCKHGSFWDCADRYQPGKPLARKWEKCMTIDTYSWGYRAYGQLQDYLTTKQLIAEVVQVISLGGNILINIGPTSRGEIIPIFEERLRDLGSWLSVNGDAIYNTTLWAHQNDSSVGYVWYTAKTVSDSQTDIYATMLSWPNTTSIVLADPVTTSNTKVSLLGYPTPLTWAQGPGGNGIQINIPAVPVEELPSKWAWSLKLEGLQNQKHSIHPSRFSKNYESTSMRKDHLIKHINF